MQFPSNLEAVCNEFAAAAADATGSGRRMERRRLLDGPPDDVAHNESQYKDNGVNENA